MTSDNNYKKIWNFYKGFIDLLLTCFVWNKPNKATRKTWWLSKIMIFIILTCFVITASLFQYLASIGVDLISLVGNVGVNLYMIVAVLTAFYMNVNVSVKRLRDVGVSPFFAFFIVVPLVNTLLFCVLGFFPSKKS